MAEGSDPAAGEATSAAIAPTNDPLWDDWDTPPRVTAIPELHVAGFDGPMDLLLDLAERQRIDLGRISALELVEQVLAGLERVQRHVPLERRADWLVMAARLVLLRSRLLFPASPEEATTAAQEAERALGQLREAAFLRAAAGWMATRPQLGRDVFARPAAPSPKAASYMALMEACLVVLQGRDGQGGAIGDDEVYRPPVTGLFRVDEALRRIRTLVAGEGGRIAFERCLPTVTMDDPDRPLKARSAVASSFAAVLELTREGEAEVRQDEHFGTLSILGSGPP